MPADQYQKKIAPLLREHFKKVEVEWSVSRDGNDQFGRYQKALYLPRLDIAVGHFNTKREGWEKAREIIFNQKTHPLVSKLLGSIEDSDLNKNPRCLLAIEVSFSGSAKHMLGDIANASIMGLVGIIITNDKTHEKVKRISNYLTLVSGLEKTPTNLFKNIQIFSKKEFVDFLTKNQPAAAGAICKKVIKQFSTGHTNPTYHSLIRANVRMIR